MIYTTIPFDGTLTDDQKNNITEWVKALRSGDWAQCTASLVEVRSDGKGWCCLGVACMISGCKEKNPEEITLSGTLVTPSGLEIQAMPNGIHFVAAFGFTHHTYVIRDEEGTPCSFTAMNDGFRFSFGEIANVIESCFITRTPITIEK